MQAPLRKSIEKKYDYIENEMCTLRHALTPQYCDSVVDFAITELVNNLVSLGGTA